MTQGVVVVLGESGRNFASGMSNGVAYVLDEFGVFARRVQDPAVGLERLAGGVDEELLLALVRRHVLLTRSARGQAVLSRWAHFRPRFWKVAARTVLASETGERLVRAPCPSSAWRASSSWRRRRAWEDEGRPPAG